MPLWIAALLGVVEGLTEFLPVSSTGHLILVAHAFALHDDATKTFEVVIQSGAIVAVMVHFRRLLATRVSGLLRRDPDAMRLAVAIAAAFVPTAAAGFLLRKLIKQHLFGAMPVVGALIVGGVAMILVDRWLSRRPPGQLNRLEDVDARKGFFIGVAQCLALWPGASRAMCTIVGGQVLGLSTATAAEFSFLLALPVLGAATALDLIKGGGALFATTQSTLAVLVGFAVSFLVAWLVIALFLRFLRTRGLAIFGWYRIVLGLVVFALLRR